MTLWPLSIIHRLTIKCEKVDNHHHHFNGRIGLVIGAAMGLINGFMSMTADVAWTIFLAVIGSTAGYFTNLFWQYLREKRNNK